MVYLIPHFMIRSRKIEHGAKCLSLEEEKLVSFLLKCAQIGHPCTQKQRMALVQEIMNGKRLPKSFLRTGGVFQMSYSIHCCPTVICQSNGIREGTIELANGNPSHVFNCDETGIPLNSEVVGKVGATNLSYLTGT